VLLAASDCIKQLMAATATATMLTLNHNFNLTMTINGSSMHLKWQQWLTSNNSSGIMCTVAVKANSIMTPVLRAMQ